MEHANLLLVIDPDAADHPCIARGADLARGLGATLELYVCDVVHSVPEGWIGALNLQQYRALLRERHVQLLEQLALPLRAQGLQVITRCDMSPSLEEGVLRHVVATKPRMVIDDELFGMRRRVHGAQQASHDGEGLPAVGDPTGLAANVDRVTAPNR
jgi:hypothetical protein